MAWPTSIITWVSGTVTTAAQLNDQIRDSLNALGGPWTGYTPTYQGSIGNGTIGGAYREIGKTVDFEIQFVAGSTTTFVGGLFLGLPVATSLLPIGAPIGIAYLLDSSVGSGSRQIGVASYAGGTNTLFITTGKDSSATLTTTVPWTWATGDQIYVSGRYRQS